MTCKSFKWFYPARAICKGKQCKTYVRGTPLYFDSRHLSIPGAVRLELALRVAIMRG
ncbi:SGNH hydrolase domain-containing protein [Novosphingobium sp. 32-60-15]|uniref:SGNH hydrolase domain-containing protein n=1 Tax=unclassified Novosphingobium TaxID=2644732 RepID=UPI00344BDBE2